MSEEELPEGWTESTMGDIADVVGGGTPKASDPANFAARGHPWITPADLSGYRDVYIRRGGRDLSDEGLRTSSAKLVPAGTVLMSSRAPIGYLAVAANPLSTNQGFRSFICKPGIHSEFVYYWLMYSRDLIEEMGSGSTFTEISGSRCKEIPFRFPSVVEQKRIAAKLKELFAVANATRERLARVPAILKRFRQAVLAAACEGRLTEGWRTARTSADVDDADLPRGWKRIEAGAAYLAANYGTSVKCDRDRRGVPVLRVPNIASGRLDTGDLKFAPKGSVNLSSLAVSPGDVLICRTNGSLDLVGKAALVPVLPKTFSFASYLIRVRLDAEILRPALFHLFLLSPVARDQIEDRARTTAGQFNLNLQILRGLEMPLPPPDEQDEIVRRVEALFKLADAVDKRVAAATARAERLTQAILAKAFRGELVPTEAELARREGRAYEPASALLEPNPC